MKKILSIILLLTTFSFGYENHCGISNLSYENNEFINDTHESKDRSSALDFCLIIFELIETARVNGIVKNGQVSLLKKTKISKVNFIFQITDKEFRLNDIQLLFNKKNLTIPELIVLKKNNDFLVSGNLNNQDLSLNNKDIKNFINSKFLKKNFKEIIFDTKSNFSFKIDKNFKV